MGGKRFINRLSLEARIARAVCFSVVTHPRRVQGRRLSQPGHYRRITITLDQAREIATQMDAERAKGEPCATIRALSPEGTWMTVPPHGAPRAPVFRNAAPGLAQGREIAALLKGKG